MSYVLACVFRHSVAPKGRSRDDPMQVGSPKKEEEEAQPRSWQEPSLDSSGKSGAKGVGGAKDWGSPGAAMGKSDNICNC